MLKRSRSGCDQIKKEIKMTVCLVTLHYEVTPKLSEKRLMITTTVRKKHEKPVNI